jgi:Family of unknown function (DUF5754)
MKRVILRQSPNSKKKYRVEFENGTHVDFGAKGYEDYTMHKDPVRKARYIIRHRLRENWRDPTTAGFWSRWLLWESPSIRKAQASIYKKFNISITYKNAHPDK